MAPPLVLPDGWLLISFLALLGCTACRWELSRFLISIRGRQAAKAKRELAGTEVRRGAGWKGWLRESMCQAIRILRATAALAALLWRERWPTSTYSWCQGFDSRQACWAASTAAQPSSREPDLFSGPVCGRPSPDWRTRGASRP